VPPNPRAKQPSADDRGSKGRLPRVPASLKILRERRLSDPYSARWATVPSRPTSTTTLREHSAGQKHLLLSDVRRSIISWTWLGARAALGGGSAQGGGAGPAGSFTYFLNS